MADKVIDKVEQFLKSRFTDPSRKLPEALAEASERAWRSLELALAGESFWSVLARRGEDKAFSASVRAFLDANPLKLPPATSKEFTKAALAELRAARQAGIIPGAPPPINEVARRAADLARFSDPAALLAAEWEAATTLVDDLRCSGYPTLADLVALRPEPSQGPLLLVAMRFFLRRKIETDDELFRGLVYEQVDSLGREVQQGFLALSETLDRQEVWLASLLDVADDTRERVVELQGELRGMAEKFDRLLERDLRPSDFLSVRSEGERRLLEGVLAKYRALPEEQRHKVPELIGQVARLELVAGDAAQARRDFQKNAELARDKGKKAQAHHGAFLAALEQQDYQAALGEYLEANRLNDVAYALFPASRYQPERILGAGGFGVVFLCRNRMSGGRVVVKGVRTETLDRDIGDFSAEAGALEELIHPSIVRLRDCALVNDDPSRPYLVMDYFEGITLEEYVRKHGMMTPADVRAIGHLIAGGLGMTWSEISFIGT